MDNECERNTLINIGLNIKGCRMEKLLSQVDLGHLCEMEKSRMSRLEAGKTNVTIKTLCALADGLDVQISAFTKSRL